jgi:hypothetical protein
LYFSLTDEEMLIVKKYRTVKGQIFFIRLLGYFKAKQQFYKFELGQDNDSQFILGKYFEGDLSGVIGQLILKLFKNKKLIFSACSALKIGCQYMNPNSVAFK